MKAEKRREGRRIRKQRRIFQRTSEAFASLGSSAGLVSGAMSGMFTQFSEALARDEVDRG